MNTDLFFHNSAVYQKTIRFFIFFIISSFTAFGQKIDYNIPEGYEQSIKANDYRKIVDKSVAVISKRFKIDFVKEGSIQLKSGQEMQAFNLHNLITKCTSTKDKNKWDEIIETHFQKMFNSLDKQKTINPNDFETVKKYLSIRIYEADFITQNGGVNNLVAKTDLEGTFTLLMLDLPDAFTPVQKSAFNLWKKSEIEVFALAQKNINQQKIEKVTRKFNVDGTEIEMSFLGNEDYAASYILDLENNSPEFVGEWGTVIAVPNKGLANLCKITKDKPLDFVKFIQKIKPAVSQFYKQHQNPVSEDFYWYYKGKFTKMNVLSDTNGNINVISPIGLTELMTQK